MQWQPLDLRQVQQFYDLYLVRDFPPEELKPLSAIEALWQQGLYQAWGCFAPDGGLKAYAYLVYAPASPYALLDYYAVLPAYRAEGLGSVLLQELQGLCGESFAALLIECEDPEFAPDPDLARRRMGFYSRAGAVWPGLGSRLFDGHYQICCLSCRGGQPPAEAENALAQVYRLLVPPDRYRGGVDIFPLKKGADAGPRR